MEKRIIGNKSTPLSHLGHQVKQLLTTISKNIKIDSHLINIPTETPPSFEILHIPSMRFPLPDKFISEEAEKTYIQNVFDPVADHTMVIFTDVYAQGNPGPVGSGTAINRQVFQLNLQMPVNLKPSNQALTSLLKILEMLEIYLYTLIHSHLSDQL